MRKYHPLSCLIILYHITSFNYANNREKVAGCNSYPRRPRNWIVLSYPSDILHGLEESPSCPRNCQKSHLLISRHATLARSHLFPAFPDKQLPLLPIQCYNCAPGNSYHVKIVNHGVPAGIIDFYKSTLLRAQYSLILYCHNYRSTSTFKLIYFSYYIYIL